MLWTLDSFRGQSQALPNAPTRQRERPLSNFYWGVDMMFYAAAIGFAACVIVLLAS